MASLAELEEKLFDIERRNSANYGIDRVNNKRRAGVNPVHKPYNSYIPKYETFGKDFERDRVKSVPKKRTHLRPSLGIKILPLIISIIFVFLLSQVILSAYVASMQTKINIEKDNISKIEEKMSTVNSELEYQKNLGSINKYVKEKNLIYPDKNNIIKIKG